MIPQHYPIELGKLYGGEYPGHREPDIAKIRLRHLITLGVRTFLDLTTDKDRLAPYEELLVELEQETGVTLRRISVPVPDMGVPDLEKTMHEIMDAVRGSITERPAVYVHCWGGIGRTGTAVGCWLRECGHDAEAALQRVQHLYSAHMPKAKTGVYPESPQTSAQKEYIRNWNVDR